jgi:hypothetical protein
MTRLARTFDARSTASGVRSQSSTVVYADPDLISTPRNLTGVDASRSGDGVGTKGGGVGACRSEDNGVRGLFWTDSVMRAAHVRGAGRGVDAVAWALAWGVVRGVVDGRDSVKRVLRWGVVTGVVESRDPPTRVLPWAVVEVGRVVGVLGFD